MVVVHPSGSHLFHLAAGAYPAGLSEVPGCFHRVDVFFQGNGNDAAVESLYPVCKSGFNPSNVQLIAKTGFRKANFHSEIKTREEKFESDSENLQPAGTETQGSAGHFGFYIPG